MLQNRTPASWLAGDSLLSEAPTRATARENWHHSESESRQCGRATPRQASDPRGLSSLESEEGVTPLGFRGTRSPDSAEGRVPGLEEGPPGPSDPLDEIPLGNPLTRAIAVLLVQYKRWLSPLLPRACRFTPTCSEYARLAILKHGLVRGGARAVWRILRCNPFHPGGVDLP